MGWLASHEVGIRPLVLPTISLSHEKPGGQVGLGRRFIVLVHIQLPSFIGFSWGHHPRWRVKRALITVVFPLSRHVDRPRSTVEESEEDEDSALYGYMSFLNNALAASPPTLEDTTKARTGMDPAPPSGREDRTGAAGGRGRGRGKGEHNPVVEAEGRGLVRELVEQCLFAVPPKRGSPLENDGYGGGDFEDDEVTESLLCNRLGWFLI